MNDGVIIQARSGSTRLPSKILRQFDGERRIIDIILENIRESLPGKKVILATTTNPADNVLAEVAAMHGVECFRGSEEDVLSRFTGAARQYSLERVIRVCSDNPFLDISSFATLFDAHTQSPADYVAFGWPDGTPTIKSHLGLYPELVTSEALFRAEKETAESLFHEHVTNYLYTHPERFKVNLIPMPDWLKTRRDLRLTLDTPSDFALLSELYKLHRDTTDGSLQALVALVDSNPAYGAVMKKNIEQNNK